MNNNNNKYERHTKQLLRLKAKQLVHLTDNKARKGHSCHCRNMIREQISNTGVIRQRVLVHGETMLSRILWNMPAVN